MLNAERKLWPTTTRHFWRWGHSFRIPETAKGELPTTEGQNSIRGLDDILAIDSVCELRILYVLYLEERC